MYVSENYPFNGLGMNLGNLSRLSNAQTRSISPENFSGAKGQGGMAIDGTGTTHARDLGQGWKISPSIIIQAQSTLTIAEIQSSISGQQPTPRTGVDSSCVYFGMERNTRPSNAPLGISL